MIRFLLKYCILIIPIFIILLNLFKYRFINTRFIKGVFNDHVSVGIVGHRRMGKDTLSSYLTYKKKHNSNIALHPYTNVVNIRNILIPGINRKDLIDGKLLDVDRCKFAFLDNPTFISDSQLYFPNYEDSLNKKTYPGFPEQMAIWGHLFDGGIHFNIQIGGSLWLQLRKHIYTVVECRGCVWFPFHVLIKTRYYERTKDYEDGCLPLKTTIFNKFKVDMIIENGKRGLVRDCWILVPRKCIQHDTHIFRKIIFKEEVKQDGRRFRSKKKIST